MYKARNVLTFLCMLFVAQGLHAQRQELEAFPALMNLIRGEKFDVILPQVMEDNGIDMWIHVIRGEDPLNFEVGDNSGIYIFTDRGEARIERAVLSAAKLTANYMTYSVLKVTWDNSLQTVIP